MKSLCFCLGWLSAVLCVCRGYTLRTSVSWVGSNDVVEPEDADLSEEVAPALLVDTTGLWKKQADSRGEIVKPKEDSVAQLSSRLFSYPVEKVKSSSSPPPHQETARTARYIAHSSDWGVLSTISIQEAIKGIPFGNIFSVSDGPSDNSTGIIYFYMTPMDSSVSDLKINPYTSLTFSEAEGDFCRQMIYDPEDPRCARLTLTGKLIEVPPEDLLFAKEAMFSRHPFMAKWPVSHKWFFMRLELIQVWLQDWVGGTSLVPLEEYFQATPY